MNETSLTIARNSTTSTSPGNHPSLTDALIVWLRIGLMSFGGPAAQIALMHHEIVDRKGWLTEQQYLNALSFCMLLPGPEAMQLATYAGWRLHGTIGGLLAGLLFVLPGALVVLCLALIYAYFGEVPIVSSLFVGIKAAVVIIVIEALHRVAKRALSQRQNWIMAGLAFIGLFFLSIPYPLLILAAAIYGFCFFANNHQLMEPAVHHQHPAVHHQNKVGKLLRTLILWTTLWWLPILLLSLTKQELLTELGIFFSKLAVVTFGGAYSVLAYMAQDVVTQYGWLTASQMMDGLGLAETTPGPLILVTEFVGFMAAFSQGGLGQALSGALISLWMTFVPCFMWIFAFAPYIDRITQQPRLKGALNAITAVVVGVILNLSLWFAMHVFFQHVNLQHVGSMQVWVPQLSSIQWQPCLLAVLCAVLIFRFKQGIALTLIVSAGIGGILSVL
ncbi:chromate transporter [Hahella sp. CCB-MM4]|uniref:chromate efflux transporter n=1 Tax=Hahella sp. (strain CCB-MM4) TaxID=1926491 RepID=UPI000B9C128B|nr:chromate efflux transporter [Hahella sp. CCB-MM4]OZG74592.1 chromate transporter [Hahella sp. CCB-MM4]